MFCFNDLLNKVGCGGKGSGECLGIEGCFPEAKYNIGLFPALPMYNLCNKNSLLLVSFWLCDLGQVISPQFHHMLNWGLHKMTANISFYSKILSAYLKA